MAARSRDREGIETEAGSKDIAVGGGSVDIGEDVTWDGHGMFLGPDGAWADKTPISRDQRRRRHDNADNGGAESSSDPESVNETLQNERGNG